MNNFGQFDIKYEDKCFVGDKVKMNKILGKEIIVHDFKIGDSIVFKERGTGKCLCIQITFNAEKHIVFTGSCGLIEMIQMVPKDGFPFTTTIIEENERFMFT